MTILTAPVSWRRHQSPTETRASHDLTPEEQANAKAAIRFLAKRHGSYAKLAAAMKVTETTLRSSVVKRRKVSAGVALRAARVAKVPLEDVLAGRWPAAGACPTCGRG